ncbi:hypothetical protein A1O1_01641 [Capronia coronata CBS 617.96]|uniref:Zn(2)-C6 fungal-type domain-containing protein n=1 Tax=Capronia coronata CBS 617.96 TaxID=1182541 RepID=W9Z3H9_9EURO|nr:uncharacterized protein A1O1_01641 [Capronia coronata CBS 617.96]EXJ96515.1 hypothetical protein A1O1_01641 [Capronia coronata CBS 617.96]
MSRPGSPVSPLSGGELRHSGGSTAEGSNGAGVPQQPRKTRATLACKRCKRRKQRCDGGYPACRSCERAGSSCIYEKTIRPQYPGGKSLYIKALEERIAFLEARLPDYAEDHFEAPAFDTQSTTGTRQYPRSKAVDDEDHSSLVDGVAYLSLRASGTTDTAPEPFYLGSSSGATIARMIQSAIFHGSSGTAVSEAIAASQSHQLDVPESALPSVPLSVRPDGSVSEFPLLEQSKLLFDIFFDRLHTRWPMLDRQEYSVLFNKQYEKGVLSITQRSIMHLIYAISARFLQLTGKICGVDHERHLVAAIEPMDYILEQHNMATVQFLLLLAVHGQRSPYGAGAWSQVRYAVSLCIELGLHRKRKVATSTKEARDNELRRRAFWSCYCLDRGTSVVLGRAFAIADRDINVELPSLSVEYWSLTHRDPPDTSRGTPWSNIAPFVHIIKLERIQSRIHRTVFRVDKDAFAGPPEQRAKLDGKMARMRADLDEWIRTIPYQPKDAKRITWMYDPESAYHDSRDFFNLQYHKAVLNLFTVLLPRLDSTDPRFVTAARSAACVCVAYQRLNQQKTLSYTMISLHSCFVAGLTLMYCLWRDGSLFSFDVLEASRACSQSLTIFGEKWVGAVKYRDIFDALSGSLFKAIINPATGTSNSANLGPLRVDLDTDTNQTAAISRQTPTLNESQPQPQPQTWPGTSKPTMIHMVSDAVKEAFMEVDEEAPGGWQGWKMWNEMVTEHESYAETNFVPGSTAARGEPSAAWWPEQDNNALYAANMPQQNSNVESFDQYGAMGAAGWDYTELGMLG